MTRQNRREARSSTRSNRKLEHTLENLDNLYATWYSSSIEIGFVEFYVNATESVDGLLEFFSDFKTPKSAYDAIAEWIKE